MHGLKESLGVQLKGLPFVVFDQGGVMEMIDSKGMAGNVILEPTADALYTKLSGVCPGILFTHVWGGMMWLPAFACSGFLPT